MNKPLTLIAGLLLTTAQAHAECSTIGDGLKQKIEDYKAFRVRNDATLQSLLQNETNCQETGAKVSSKIAALADATTCQAQLDASHIDQEMTEIGEKCERVFIQINALQATMRTSFEDVKVDLAEGTDYMMKSRILNDYCADEIKAARKLVDNFLQLEQHIFHVETRSVDGKVNYGKFKETAKSLHAATSSRNSNCGELASASLQILKSATKGAVSAPVPAGKSPRTASDVTGVDEAKKMANKGREIMDSAHPAKVEIAAGLSPAPRTQEARPSDITSPADKASAGTMALSGILNSYLATPAKKEAAPEGRSASPAAPAEGRSLASVENASAGVESGTDQAASAADPSAHTGAKAPASESREQAPPTALMASSIAAAPAASTEPAASTVKFLGEVGATPAASETAEADLFVRVSHAYQRSSLDIRLQSAKLARALAQ